MSFVDLLSEPQQAQELVNYFAVKFPAAQGAFVEQCTKHISEGAGATLLTELLNHPGIQTIFASPDQDAEGYFNIIVSLMNKIAQADEAQAKLVDLLIKTVCANPTDKHLLRLKILGNMFTVLQKPRVRYQVFLAVVQYAAVSKAVDAVIGKLSTLAVTELVRAWSLDSSESRKLYLAIVRLFEGTVQHKELAYAFRARYLATFEGEAPAVLADAANDAYEHARETIASPDRFVCDDVDALAAVQHLAHSTQALHVQMLRLLQLVHKANLDRFLSWKAETDASLLTQMNLDLEACENKMRLLTLASLAASQRELPYSQISTALHVAEDDIEACVIQAISLKLLSARIDQRRRLILVLSSTQREFGTEQWRELDRRLQNWQGAVHNILQNLHAAEKSAAAAAPA